MTVFLPNKQQSNMNTSKRQQSVFHSVGSSNNPSPTIQTFHDFLVIPMMSHQAPGQHQFTFSARNGIAISPVAHRSLCSRLANCPGSVGCVRWTRAILVASWHWHGEVHLWISCKFEITCGSTVEATARRCRRYQVWELLVVQAMIFKFWRLETTSYDIIWLLALS